jgi:hypothetical protein
MDMNEQQQKFVEAAVRLAQISDIVAADDLDITIYGQPVIDHVIDLRNPMRIGGLSRICSPNPDGELVFKAGSYIGTRMNGSAFKFGPLGKNNARYIPGGKYTVGVEDWDGETEGDGLASLGYPVVNLGGGGPNALYVLSKVFGGLRPEFVGTYSQKIDRTIMQVLDERVGKGRLDCIKLYNNPPINIVVEGMGPKSERMVLKSPFPPTLLKEKHRAHGKTVMVNTVYNNSLAVGGLTEAVSDGKLGVLALTDSLCRTEKFSDEEKAYFDEMYGRETFNGINSMYSFVIKLVLGSSSPITIMNEAELEHLTGVKVNDRNDGASHVYFDRVLQGLKRVREYQLSHKPRIYFTMGANGSLCLDENDVLHYHGITDSGLKRGKNAIGDTYAAAILGAEHIGRFYRRNLSPSVIMDIAAAAADAAVAEGVDRIDVPAVDRALTKSHAAYIELGPLAGIDEKYGTSHDRVSDLLENNGHYKLSLTGKGMERIPGLHSVVGMDPIVARV